MACPTCSCTMQNLGVPEARFFWCPRCGTVSRLDPEGRRDDSRPALVERVRDLRETMREKVGFSAWDVATWHRLGITEAIHLPGERE